MNRLGISVLTAAICLLFALEVCGQTQRQSDVRQADPYPRTSKLGEPDSPETGSIVSGSPMTVVPRLMKFSGLLHDASGKPLNGAVDVTFTLYSSEAGRTPLWFETQSVQADELGRYTALLGAMHTEGLPIDLFTSGEVRWLGIQVGLEVEQPRVLLVSVPYALKAGDAETLGGKPASAYMLSDVQNVSTSSGATGSATGTPTTIGSGKDQKSHTANTTPLTAACSSVTSIAGGTINSIPKFTATCNIETSLITQSGSNVGIGTASPGSTLHLVGNNSTLTISGTGTHQVNIVGATGGRLGQDATGFFFSSDTNGAPIRFATNNGSAHEWMRITSAGNVGIGTTTPAARLDVAGGVNASGNITTGGTFTAANETVTGVFNLPLTTSASVGVINMNGSALIHTCCTNSNVFMGYGTGNFTTTGTSNTATGSQALLDNTSGSFNTASGYSALHTNSTGANNTATGGHAMQLNTTGGNNTATGFQTLFGNTTGINNTANGWSSMVSNITGNDNTAIGVNALNGNTAGSYNAAGGFEALQANEGNWSTAFGSCALLNTAGTSTGSCTALSLGSSDGNTAAGGLAGKTNTSGGFNTFLGFSADANSGTLTNATAIGANALVAQSNSLVLGSINGVNGASSDVKVGIGTSSPGQKLSVNGAVGIWNASTANFYTDAGSTLKGTLGPGRFSDISLISSVSSDYLRLGANNSAIGFWTNGNAAVDDSPQMILDTAQLSAFGTCLAGSCPSDARFKKDIEPYPAVLNKLVQLQPVSYAWRADEFPEYHFGNSRTSGLIAQEVEKVFPEMVSLDARGHKTVNYSQLPFLTLEGVRELKERNDILRQKLSEEQTELRQVLNQNQNQRAEIQKLAGQVRVLKLEQTEITALKARLDRLEKTNPQARHTRSSKLPKGKPSPKTEVARF